MKKILLSIMVLSLVVVGAVMGTRAYFSDTETSVGNTLTAGAIDLGIDNESYIYDDVLGGMALNSGTSWDLSFDLDDGEGPGLYGAYLYFALADVKPGDYGEDTVSFHVNNNNSWVCAEVTLTGNDDNGLTEPESDDGDVTDGSGAGELANAVEFLWWADDGDNVLEEGEAVLPGGNMGQLGLGSSATIAIADSSGSIYDPADLVPVTGAITGAQTYYVGKGWCFGVPNTSSPVPQDEQGKIGTNGPDVRGAGFSCDGSGEDNTTQSDSLTADISFTAVQARNNSSFICGAQ